MTDLTQVSDANLLAAIKERSNAKIAEALPHIEALLKLFNPEDNILQGTSSDTSAKAVYQACTVFKRNIDQMVTASKATPKTPGNS